MPETTFPQIEEQPVMWGYYREFHDAQGYKAIVDRDSGKLFSIVSKDYRLIRHEQAIDELESILYRTESLGSPCITTLFYNDGGRMCRTYRFATIKVEMQPGDMINPELSLYNSYDLTWPLALLLGAFRVVCTNGLVVGHKLYQFKKRHVLSLERMNFTEQVETALTRFGKQVDTWKRWEARPLTLTAYEKVMEAMAFGKKANQTIEDQIDDAAEGFLTEGYPQPTVWAFYNMLTWYITHQAVSLNHRVELQNRLRGAMAHFGN